MSDQDAVLEEVCRSAVRLVSTVPAPPSRVRVQRGDVVVDLEWPASTVGPAGAPASTVGPAGVPAGGLAGGPAEPAPGADALEYLCAPTVGTFYLAPEPGAAPFVVPGDTVEPGQQVAILESMKLMNPIEADCAGTVVAVLAADGASVEYDQRLVAIRPGAGS